MTILGYIFVIMLSLVIVYVGCAWLFGAFNVANIPIEGLKFAESEVVISENGGTATLTLVSKAGEEQDKAAQESEEPVEKGVYNVKSIKVMVQNDLGNEITTNCPITLPDNISMGKPFTITANINPTDKANIGGDCYLVATVEGDDGRIYMTERGKPLHVFVDVPVEKIELVKAVGYDGGDQDKKVYLNQEVVDILDNQNKKIGEYDKIISPLIVTDTVGLEVQVYPTRALTPHTALIYTDPKSASYVPPKAPFFTPSTVDGLVVNSAGQVYVKNKYNDLDVEAAIYRTFSHAENDYASRRISFNIQNTEFGGVDIYVDDFVTFTDVLDEDGEVVERIGTINFDLHLKETPVLAFVLNEEEISNILFPQAESQDEPVTMADPLDGEEQTSEIAQVYQELLDNQKIIDLKAGIYAKVNDSFNVRHPASLQNLLTNFEISIDEDASGFKTEDKPMPEWIRDNPVYNYPIRIAKVGLSENNTAPFVWFVYITREIQDGEDISLKFNLATEGDESDYSYPVKYTTKKLRWDAFDFVQVLPETVEVEKDIQDYSTLSMMVNKNGNIDSESILDVGSQEFLLGSNTTNADDVSYSRLIYLVKSGKKVIAGELQEETSIANYNNLNILSSRILKTINDAADNSKEFLLGDTYYCLLSTADDNEQFILKALSGGDVEVYPFVVKTNSAGHPIDAYYNEINPDTVEGIIYGDGTEKTTTGDLQNKYVVLSTISVEGKSQYYFTPLKVKVKETLSSFSFYRSTDFVEKIDSIAVEPNVNTTVYVLPNSRLALSTADVIGEPGSASVEDSSAVISVNTPTMPTGNTSFPYFELVLHADSLAAGTHRLTFTYSRSAQDMTDLTTELSINVLSTVQTNNKSIVFRDASNNYAAYGKVKNLKETIYNVSFDQNYLYMYLQNGTVPQAFYETQDTNGSDYIQYQSNAIQYHYYLIKDQTYNIDDVGVFALETLLTLNDENSNQQKLEFIVEMLKNASESLDGDVLCARVDDKIQTYLGQIYQIDNKVLAKLNQAENQYKLYCIATDFDINTEASDKTTKNFASLKIIYTPKTSDKGLTITRAENYDADLQEYVFDDKEIFLTQISSEKGEVEVLTNYGKSISIEEAINLSNFTIKHLANSRLFSISLSNGSTGNTDTLILKCDCYLGIKSGDIYLQAKNEGSSVETELNTNLNIYFNTN